MNDLRRAAEIALEALETLWDILDDIDTTSDIAKENDAWYRKRVEFLQKKRWDTSITTDGYKLKGGVIEALRQALAQPEQEPVGYVTIENISSWAQVPSIKWFKKPTEGPLYTAPPKREWVGLTDEEIKTIVNSNTHDDCGYDIWCSGAGVAKSVEAKLKEKNSDYK